MLGAVFLAILPALALAIPTPSLSQRSQSELSLSERADSTVYVKRVIDQDFPDPTLLQDGSDWYAFGTTVKTQISPLKFTNVQVAHSTDFRNWTVTGIDALPTVGAWVTPLTNSTRSSVWAPKVFKNNNGKFVLHYSAHRNGTSGQHCIGAAVATTPEGPYTPQATPLACPLAKGGAIDSSTFRDVDNSLYVVYKIDGNSIGHGGVCGNTVAPLVSTPIMLQRVADNGFTPIGSPVQILDRIAADGPLIEAPSLMRTSGGQYVLFFSSDCWTTTKYDVQYAFAASVSGPYTRRGTLLVTGTDGLVSPGGADIDADGEHMVFHATLKNSAGRSYRAMYTQLISVDDEAQTVESVAPTCDGPDDTDCAEEVYDCDDDE